MTKEVSEEDTACNRDRTSRCESRTIAYLHYSSLSAIRRCTGSSVAVRRDALEVLDARSWSREPLNTFLCRLSGLNLVLCRPSQDQIC